MAMKKPTVIDHQSGFLFNHVAPMLDSVPDVYPRYALSRQLDTAKLVFVIRGVAANPVNVNIQYGTRQKKLDGTIEFVKLFDHQWPDIEPADLASTASAVVETLAVGGKPIDWIDVTAFCASPVAGNYISVKVSAAENA